MGRYLDLAEAITSQNTTDTPTEGVLKRITADADPPFGTSGMTLVEVHRDFAAAGAIDGTSARLTVIDEPAPGERFAVGDPCRVCREEGRISHLYEMREGRWRCRLCLKRGR